MLTILNKDSDIFDPEPYSTEFPPAGVKYTKLSKRKRRNPVKIDNKRYRERVTSRYDRQRDINKGRNWRHKRSRRREKRHSRHFRKSSIHYQNRFKPKFKYEQAWGGLKIKASTENNEDANLDFIDPVPYSTRGQDRKEYRKVPQLQKTENSELSIIKVEGTPEEINNLEKDIKNKESECIELTNEVKLLHNDRDIIAENNDTQMSVKIESIEEDPKAIDKFTSISEWNESLEDTQNDDIQVNGIELPLELKKFDNFVSDKLIYSFSKSSHEDSEVIEIDNTGNSLSDEGEEEDEGESNEDDINHFDVQKGFIIKDYKILKTLGEGTFGRVFQCQKLGTARLFALKIIRPKQKYIEAAKYEVEMLKEIKDKSDLLKKSNKNFRSHWIDLHNSFKFVSPFNESETHVWLVFESLGKSLFEFIKENNYRGFHVDHIMTIAQQMFEALAFIHEMGIVHTDIKPENILFQKDVVKKVTKEKDFPEQIFLKSRIYREMLKNELDEDLLTLPYILSEESKVKLIDFGGAIKLHEHHGRIINTRQYRSPEVILGWCEWNEKSDIWSLAWVLFELYTGEMLFPTHDDFEHLAMIEKLLGPIDEWMVDAAGAVANGEESEYWLDAFTKTIRLSGVNKWEGRVRWDALKERIEEDSYIEKIPIIEVR